MERVSRPLKKGASQGNVLWGSGHTIAGVRDHLSREFSVGFCVGKPILGIWPVDEARNI
jgi:hypothetical protein